MKKIFNLFILSTSFLLFCLCSPVAALEITALGDIYLSQSIIDRYLNDLLNIKLSGDIVFANFEGVLSANHTRNDTMMLKLTMPLNAVCILKKIGINTLGLANNHSLDLGTDQYSSTLSELKRHGFNVAGLDGYGEVININNTRVRFIAFSFSGKNNVNDLETATKMIRSFKEDIIIVSAHMGGENKNAHFIPRGMEFYEHEKRGDVRKFSHACIDAGADVILGHGPHMLREIELYKGKLIVYSLGNFIFDYPGVEKHMSTPTYSLTINIDSTGDFCQAKIISYTLQYGVPIIDKRNTACGFIRRLSVVNSNNCDLLFKNDCTISKKEWIHEEPN